MKIKEDSMKFRKESFALVFTILILTIFSLALVSSAYARTSPAYTQTTLQPHFGDTSFPLLFNRDMCQAGQDFILQIDPRGCTPSVIRSDLLEDQNVPVFCPIVATKLNPLIDVEAINNIRFSFNGTPPREVQGLSYVPARAALVSPKLQLNQPVLNNLGYVVIVLRRQPNESAMPDFVQGNLTATLRYDIKNAFGVGQASYYLPELSDDEWNENLVRYGFWHGRGYLRAENIDDNSATISIYSDREAYSTGKTGEKRRISTHTVELGKTSPFISIPGFNYCLGSMEIKLNGLENPGTTAKLTINNDVFELKEKEKFLENKCTVRKIERYGIVQKVDIGCNEDEGSGSPYLYINPKVNIEIDGIKEYNVGDLLYTNGSESVFLGFVETRKKSMSADDLYAILVSVPTQGRSGADATKLTPTEISTLAGKSRGGLASVKAKIKELFGNWDSEEINYGQPKEVFGKNVKLGGFASPVDVEFKDAELRNNYENAIKDYETVRQDFSSDLYPQTGSDGRTLGEKALFGQIELAWSANQKKTALDLCNEFSEGYPNSIEGAPAICDDALKLSSSESSVKDVLINGRNYLISFESVEEPDFEDYGVNVFIGGSAATEAFSGEKDLAHNERIYVSDKEYISLADLEKDYAVFDISGLDRSGTSLGSTQKVRINSYEEIKVANDKVYRITLSKINLKKVAKVEIRPNIHLTETRANFNFKIGIEKRSIQLTPEKTKEKITSLNQTLERWKGINSRLGTVVEAGKTACLLTGTALTAKNFLSNLGGKGIARQKVMRGTDGWFEKCENAVRDKTVLNGKTYDNIDSCLLGNSDQINNAVDRVSEAMKTQNEELEKLQDLYTESNSFLGEDVVNTDSLMKDYVDETYRNEITTNLKNGGVTTVRIENKDVPVSDIIKSVTPATVFMTQARNLQLNSRLLNSQDPGVKQLAKTEVNTLLTSIYVNSAKETQLKDFANELGLAPEQVNFVAEKNSKVEQYKGLTYANVKSKVTITGLGDNVPVAEILTSNGKKYVAVLLKNGDEYAVNQLYDLQGNPVDDVNLGIYFKQYDSTTYQNAYPTGSARIKYFERDPYKGLPAVVPFDLKNGWYAAVKSVIPIGGNIRAYDDSGRVSSFYLCNIGQNKKEEGIGIDSCQMINLGTGQPYNQFAGLETGEASRIVQKAVDAIQIASQARARDPKVSQVNINGQTIRVGEPAVELPDIQCQDFMSPVDCNILFNVCDPVICPSSRCDFGGTYPVQDVVQSGVAGGLLLCLPNFPEVKVPICLSAVHAGLESYLSVLDSYQQCLQTSLETGQTVGVCDEIHSVYMCDFFWRQGLPIANIVIPKAVGTVLGQNVRGGGEYLGVQDAWQRAGDSIDYMTQYYADDSYKAFKARSVAETAGTAICKNWLSITAPGGGNLLDAITQPDVPAQFYGRFDEIPITTITNPPASHYKVFYHIYAGKDFPAYYQVYLKGTAGTFFQDTDIRRVIATGFIPLGDYETQTIDLTAPSGYKEMCIVVNNQEECGFKQVTTDFGVNIITEKFVADQAAQTDITSEAACISGTPSLLNAITPNVQSAVEGAANPAIYNRGITRICATDNPGTTTDALIGTDKERWLQVGYCGNTNVKCWLDRQSVENTIKSTSIEGGVIDEVTASKELNSMGQQAPLEDSQFEAIAKEIEKEKDPKKKISVITANYNRILFNHQKGYLTLLRADAYAEIAKGIFARLKAEADAKKAIEAGKKPEEETPKVPEVIAELFGEEFRQAEQKKVSEIDNIGNDYPIFTFNDGTISNDLHYTFSGNNWYFSEDKEKWIPVGYSSFKKEEVESAVSSKLPGILNDLQQTPSDVTSVVNDVNIVDKQSQKNKEFIKSLIGNSYGNGLSKLIIRTKQNGEGGFFFDPKLSTENIDFFPDDTYTFKKDTRIFFKYESGKWSSSTNKYDWNVVTATHPLNGKNGLDGAVYLFSVDTEAGIGSIPTTTGTTGETTSLTCSSNTECQQALGEEIIKIAREIKQEKGISDTIVKQDTGAENFECLVLMVAMGESTIKQCQLSQVAQDPLYCNGDEETTLGGDGGASLGVMQIYTSKHPNANAEDFEDNVKYGATLLADGYSSGNLTYRCYRQVSTSIVRESDFVSKSYSGWQRALRNYNGWNSQCYTTNSDGTLKAVGNPTYVDYIIGKKDSVKALFPEVCG